MSDLFLDPQKEFKKLSNNMEIPKEIELLYEWIDENGLVEDWDNNTLGITDEGKQAKIRDAKEGVCVGRRIVDEVKEWTVLGNGNQKVVRVTYTWKLTDVTRPT